MPQKFRNAARSSASCCVDTITVVVPRLTTGMNLRPPRPGFLSGRVSVCQGPFHPSAGAAEDLIDALAEQRRIAPGPAARLGLVPDQGGQLQRRPLTEGLGGNFFHRAVRGCAALTNLAHGYDLGLGIQTLH